VARAERQKSLQRGGSHFTPWQTGGLSDACGLLLRIGVQLLKGAMPMIGRWSQGR